MRDQLIRYVDLLFAGAPDAGDIKQEILQNTLDRYDDLLEQGKTPQAAYSLAISGIGDINEILSGYEHSGSVASVATMEKRQAGKPGWKVALQAIGICLYIMCPIPLFVLQDATGLCGLLVFVAAATALMMISGGKGSNAEKKDEDTAATPQSELHKAVKTIIWAAGLCIYLMLSFSTGAWYITWVIFPIITAVQGLVKACMDLKEAKSHET